MALKARHPSNAGSAESNARRSSPAPLAEALPRCPKLTTLTVYMNPGPADALALALIKALEAGVTFDKLDCDNIGLSEAVHQQLRAAFEASGNDSLKCD